MNQELNKADSDEKRIDLLSQQIAEQEKVVFMLQYDLALAEGTLEGLKRLRERVGMPTLSHKHTLRGRLIKYLTEHPESECSEIARALDAPVTSVNMALHRNKELFEQTPNKTWVNRAKPVL